MHTLLLTAITVFCMLLSTTAISDTSLGSDASSRPRIGLVLSGGGARGLAHVGVLQVLEELKVPVDCIAGTSMGALVGGSYAAGVAPEIMRAVLSQNDVAKLFDDLPPRSEIPHRVKRDDYRALFDFTVGYKNGEILLPTGASAGYKFELFLKDLIGQGSSVAALNFDTLPIPFRAIATDLESGDMQVFNSGELAKVMRASMSLPGVVAPTEINGRVYVDGGLVRNLPVDIGRELCGDIIIAVNVGTPLQVRENIKGVIDIANQTVNLLTEQNVKHSLSELTSIDIPIEPALEEISVTDFDAGEEIIEAGLLATIKKSVALSRIALNHEAYTSWQNQRKQRVLGAPPINNINIVVDDSLNAEAIQQDITVEPGENFSTATLHKDLARIYGRGDFSYLGYSVIPDEEGANLEIHADAKPWGPNYLKFGVSAASDFSSPTQFNLAASYRRNWTRLLGAEWRTDLQAGYDSFIRTEYTQPLQLRDGAFIATHARVRRNIIQFYDGKLRVGQYNINTARAGFDIGISSSVGELRIGPYVNRINAEPDFGILTPSVPKQRLTQVGYELAGVIDQLDSLSFPRSGKIVELNIRGTNMSWGSDDEYTRAELYFTGVKSFGKNTLSAGIELGDELSCCIEVYDPFQLGGPLRLSGLNLDQLTGSRYQLARLGLYHQYSNLPSQFGRGLYYGVFLEAGRIDNSTTPNPSPYDWETSVSAYWGADTVLGTLIIGYGFSSLNQQTAYLMLGPRF